jgi:thiosulfate dehydrogenase (quinone) large subunit
MRRSLRLRAARVRGREITVPQLRRGRALSRRALLAHVLGLAGLLTAGAAAASTLARGTFEPAARARPRRRAAGAPAGTTDLGPARALARGDSLSYSYPASGEPAIVVRARDGELFALSAVCTHAGCELAYRQGELACPCHSSTFDLRTGAPQRGPARSPLATAAVAESGGRIVARTLGSE